MRIFTDDLYRRIKEGECWFYSKTNRVHSGLKCRNNPASATLIEYFNNPRRVELFGLAFLVQIDALEPLIVGDELGR